GEGGGPVGDGGGAVRRRGAEPAHGVAMDGVPVRGMHLEQTSVLDQVQAREPAGQRGGGCDRGIDQPGEPGRRFVVVERGDHEGRERVAQRKRESRSVGGGPGDGAMLPGEAVVPHVYTARIRVCHHELDAFGRMYPAGYLRHLAAVAVDASSAAGFDGAYYAKRGVHWLVRRTTLDVAAPATVG